MPGEGFHQVLNLLVNFFAICILITVFYFIKKDRGTIQELLSISCLFGLYKINNFAAIVSLIMLILSLFFMKKSKLIKSC